MSASRLQHYIYKITNKTTGEYYIGKHTSLDWRTDDYMGSGTLLKRKMEAHPDHEWTKEVLLLLSSEEQAYEYEIVAIGDRWRDDPLCLNLMAGGFGKLGSNKADIENRERRMADWLDGEKLPDVENIYMINDETKTKVQVIIGLDDYKKKVRDLIGQGYYFGYSCSYKKVHLKDLGLSSFATKEENTLLINGGVFPDKRSLSLMNHDLRAYVVIVKSKRAMLIVNDLLSKGWVIGGRKGYKLVPVSKVSTESSVDHNYRYLQGLPCLNKTVNMTSPCKTKSVGIGCKKNQPYPQIIKELYDLGWTFGKKTDTITVGLKELRASSY